MRRLRAWRGSTGNENPQRRHGNAVHVNHFQSLILARAQCIAQYTSSPIINSQTAELINSYGVIWAAISQQVLHNSGALLNHSLCQKNHSAKSALLCTARTGTLKPALQLWFIMLPEPVPCKQQHMVQCLLFVKIHDSKWTSALLIGQHQTVVPIILLF